MQIFKINKNLIAHDDVLLLKGPILIFGPAYSGKSEFAHIFLDREQPAGIIGTSDIEDPNFKKRLQDLKSLRSLKWDIYENPSDLVVLLEELVSKYPQILIDSLNQWIAHILVNESAKYSLEQIEDIINQEITKLFTLISEQKKSKIVLVSSEVGGGVSPHIAMARVFRQIVGRLNIKLVQISNTVITVSAGLAFIIKD